MRILFFIVLILVLCFAPFASAQSNKGHDIAYGVAADAAKYCVTQFYEYPLIFQVILVTIGQANLTPRIDRLKWDKWGNVVSYTVYCETRSEYDKTR